MKLVTLFFSRLELEHAKYDKSYLYKDYAYSFNAVFNMSKIRFCNELPKMSTVWFHQ